MNEHTGVTVQQYAALCELATAVQQHLDAALHARIGELIVLEPADFLPLQQSLTDVQEACGW